MKESFNEQIKRRVIRILMAPPNRVLMEMPVHLCPDDGDETEERWVTDMTPTTDKIMEIVDQVYAIGYDDGRVDSE